MFGSKEENKGVFQLLAAAKCCMNSCFYHQQVRTDILTTLQQRESVTVGYYGVSEVTRIVNDVILYDFPS